MSDIGVVYLARGADQNWQARLTRFIASYQRHPAGIEHELYVIYKEFETTVDTVWAVDQLRPLNSIGLFHSMSLNSYAGGTFREACPHVTEPLACMLGSTTEIMHDDWLAKLHAGLSLPTVGLVCCTGSYGRITEFFPNLPYPNPHIRNLSFMIERERYVAIAAPIQFNSKLDDLKFEHGPDSLTKQVMRQGKTVLVVEKNRVRAPHEWGDTTYRGNLENVLVHDRGARDYQDL